MTPTISIIVPVYNVADYLPRCLNSIVSQTYKDWECILVDDGSSDSSGTICDSYATSDSRFRVFHKSNGGVSSARNLGLENALGTWVVFVDADDYTETEYLKILIQGNNADLAICGYQTFGQRVIKAVPHIRLITQTANDEKYLANLFNIPHLLHAPWGLLYRREIIEKNNLRFDLRMRLGEDSCFNYTYIGHCNTISLKNQVGYYYRLDGVSRYKMTAKDYDYHIKTMINNVANIRRYGKWGEVVREL